MPTPDRDTTLQRLRGALDAFISELERLPPERFLARTDGWSPRDVAAHIVGWLRLTIAGAVDLRRGATPSYFADADNDLATVNEGHVRRYDSTGRRQIVAELRASFAELDAFVRGIPAEAWSADTGVRYRGRSTTVAGRVAVLVGDIDAHREELRA